jgi:hypothetical protein
MVRKLVYLISFVLVLTLASSAFALDFGAVVTDWTNATGNRLWQDPGNWTLGVPDSLTISNTRINPDAFIGWPPNPKVGPIIGQGVNASTAMYDTWGPEFGMTLDIQGGSYSGPAFVGLNPFNNNPARTSVINLGQNGTGGTISVVNMLLGDCWWDAGPYNELNVYSGTCTANDYIWLGGHMNLYGGFTSATNGMNVDVPNANQAKIDNFGGLYGPGITRLNIEGGTLSLPATMLATIQGWFNAGYLVANNGRGGTILFDLDSQIDRVWVTASPVPEPATIALLCLGGLALIRRKRS